MKFLCSLIIILNCIISNGQSSDTLLKAKQIKYQRLLSRGNKEYKTGSILLAAGYTSATIGFVTALQYGYILDDWPVASTVLFVSGTAAVTTGWYFFISGAIKKKKAKAQLKLMTSKMMIDRKNYIVQPSIGIAFKF